MKKLAFLLALSGAAAAVQPPPGVVRAAFDGFEPATMTASEAASQILRVGRDPLNIQSEGAAGGAFLLGAANTGGLFGSFFTTDLFLMNPTPSSIVKLNVFALKANTNNQATTPPSGSV